MEIVGASNANVIPELHPHEITRRAGDSSYQKSDTKTVAKRKSRRPRTTVLLTMDITFLCVNASRSVLGSLG